MSIFQEFLRSLQQRHRDFAAWIRTAPLPERKLRLGPTPLSEAESGIASLSTAIDRAEREELGRCTVCHGTVDTHLLQMDYDASVCLEHLSPDERARLENELELAIKVQRALLPHAPPTLRNWEVAAFSQPASVVGGDYFDFVNFADGAEGMVIADVMGKGMPASMLMANLQASIRIMIPESHCAREVVERLNRLFRHNITLTKFVSLFVGHLEFESGKLSYVNGGHNPPFLVSPLPGQKPSFISLFPSGPAIGLVERPRFEEREVLIPNGGALILYTDGIVEARSASGEEFGEERLRNLIAELAAGSAQEITQGVRERLQQFTSGADLHDDTTLVVFRRSKNRNP
jgi:sigma-B regulation protein RsbU (phosphoserine phosphatase)